MELLRHTTALPLGSEQWNSSGTLPHYVGVVSSGNAAVTMPSGSGQRNSCGTLAHCHGVVGNGTFAVHHHIPWRQWVVELLRYTAALSSGSG